MAITINGTTGIAGVDGSASTPAVQGTDTNTGIFYPAADTIAFGEGGAEVMRIDSSGNVGIGTTSPGARFNPVVSYVASTIVTGIKLSTVGGYNTGSGTAIDFGQDQGTYSTWVTGRIASPRTASSWGGSLTFSTNDDSGATAIVERARITSGGYFKASNNGTYAGSTGAFHEFNQSVDNVNIAVDSTNASLTSSLVFAAATRNTTNNSFFYFQAFNRTAVANKFLVADSGTVTNATGTYTTISDIKLKQDITDASSQWNDIKSLRIVNYRLKDYVQADPNSKPFLGLIAQEVEQVCPGLVEEQEDEVPGEDGKLVKNGEVTKGVKTSILYMKAVKALQEAMARIETLEAQNAAFEARLAALENT